MSAKHSLISCLPAALDAFFLQNASVGGLSFALSKHFSALWPGLPVLEFTAIMVLLRSLPNVFNLCVLLKDYLVSIKINPHVLWKSCSDVFVNYVN